MEIRKEIRVSGIVQGVGFRPYVFRLASELDLSGTIANTTAGVTIQVQGPAERLDKFMDRLPQEAPTLARITRLAVRNLPCKSDRKFEILSSRVDEPIRALISPDVAICDDCLRELFDPADRRYRYPFINCTNCGPRFTIVRDIPYDRRHTSMAGFQMCAACRAEYEDPRNRRFHAQPNACWDCGPLPELWDSRGQPIATPDPIREAARRLRRGELVAIKGLGGFHLAADASNASAIEELRQRKCRQEKPLALMVPDLEAAEAFCRIDEIGRAALLSRERPIVLLPRRNSGTVVDAVAPRQSDFGVFLPYTPLHHLLFAAEKFPALVMTSGNRSEEPLAIANREAVTRLSGIADCFLVHHRDILLRCDDTVVHPVAGNVRQIRRSRGYVPAPVALQGTFPPVLAVGGELKNTVCFVRDNLAFLSQHIGDLENPESFRFFQEAIDHLSKILEIEPAILAHDLHPDYFSTKWALARNKNNCVGVQHHHAHIASCMAENRVRERVIGFALDGTGYGSDGHIWGGEALIADFSGFVRAAHFAYVAMPGGAAAIREPWRMALSFLARDFPEDFAAWDIPFVRRLDCRKVDTILRMIDRRVNAPLTSSCGRLFDAVAALVGLCSKVSYEAQAAMELEALARKSVDTGAYPFDICLKNGCWEIGTRAFFSALIQDVRRHMAPETISRRFHNGLVAVLLRLAGILRQETDLNRVCLSGGVFHNSLLLEQLVRELAAAEFEVFTHTHVPAGDGGLSLGQALVAAHKARPVEPS